MSDRNEFIRDAFHDDSIGETVRDRLWSTLQHRQQRAVRLRYLARAAGILLVGIVLAAVYAFLRITPRTVVGGRPIGPAVVAADSLPNSIPSEYSMIQEPRETAPSNLIPLLGHRSSLRIDIANAETRRDELVKRLEQASGREHQRIEQELAAVEQQLEASRVAVNIIDAQLAQHEAPVVARAYAEVPQVFQFGSPGIPDEVMYTAVGGGGVLLLGTLTLLVYMRSISRSTRKALSQLEGQVSSQHATLASGIDAIAVEVERLGEGQRFMSKILAAPEAKVRSES